MMGKLVDRTDASSKLVVVELDGGNVAAVHRAGEIEPLELPSLEPVETLARLADDFPDSYIAWYQRDLRPYLSDVDKWPALMNHHLEVLHLGCYQRCSEMAESLNLVDFSSPFLLDAPHDKRFPTWLIASAGAVTSASAIRAIGLDASFRELTPALFEFGFRGMRWGLMPISEPRLAESAPPPELMRQVAQRPSASATARLVLSNYGKAWLAFWVVAGAVFTRRLRVLGAVRAITSARSRIRPEPNLAHIEVLHAGIEGRGRAAGRSVEVLIVTLDRRDLVANLLKDLAGQTEIPSTVVIVEQGASRRAHDRLPDELRGDWPFRLDYEGVEWIGACRARNFGLEKSSSEWILLLDDDVRLPAEFVCHLLNVATDYGVDAVTGAVYRPGQNPHDVVGHGPPRPWTTFNSGSSLVSLRMIQAGCRFVERLEGGFGEDWEFGVRLRLGGANVLYAPGAPAEHLKVERGGFRHPLQLPWDGERVRPRPSPTILYSYKKYGSPLRERGYRLYYYWHRLKGVSAFRWVDEAIRMHREWRSSSRWAGRLVAGEHSERRAWETAG